MTGYDFVTAIIFLAEGDGGDNAPVFDALDKLIHILVQFDLEGMVWEVVNFRQGDFMDVGQL